MISTMYPLLIKFKDKTINWLKNPIAFGTFLVIALPPLGVLWFVLVGLYTIINRLFKNKRFPLNSSSYFYVALIISSTVALITIWHLSPYVYIPVPVLLFSYYGIYLNIFEDVQKKNQSFHFFGVSLVLGGLYLFFFSQYCNLINAWGLKIPYPLDYLTGRALLGTPPTQRLYGSAFNPNFASYLLLLSIGIALAYFIKAFKTKSWKAALLSLIIIVIYWTGILDTGSRSAVITMLVLIEIALLKIQWKVALVTTALVVIKFQALLQLIPRKGIIDLSYSNRIIIWKNALKIFWSHPIFGVSPAGFSIFYLKLTKKYVPHAHDIFLAFFSEYGLLGGGMFLVFSLVMAIYFFKMVLHPSIRSLSYSNAFLLTLPIILFTGLLDHPLYSPQVALPTVILLAFFHRYVKVHHIPLRARRNVSKD
jgi:O-antigen ligase